MSSAPCIQILNVGKQHCYGISLVIRREKVDEDVWKVVYLLVYGFSIIVYLISPLCFARFQVL